MLDTLSSRGYVTIVMSKASTNNPKEYQPISKKMDDPIVLEMQREVSRAVRFLEAAVWY